MKINPITILIGALAIAGVVSVWKNYNRTMNKSKEGKQPQGQGQQQPTGSQKITEDDAEKIAARIKLLGETLKAEELTDEQKGNITKEIAHLKGILKGSEYAYKNGTAVPHQDKVPQGEQAQ